MNELANLQNKDLTVPSMEQWGTKAPSSKAVTIPKIMVMQATSVFAQDMDHLAKTGDYVDSLTQEVIGNIKEPLEFIPFHLDELWYVSKVISDNETEFLRAVPLDSSNENWLYEAEEDGMKVRRQYVMNFYVLRPESMSLPYIVTFKGMSVRGGKALSTQMFIKNAADGLVPPAKTMNLLGKQTSNDKGTFIVIEAVPSRETSEVEIANAFKWYKLVNSGAASTLR